jgi:hypothetical protein
MGQGFTTVSINGNYMSYLSDGNNTSNDNPFKNPLNLDKNTAYAHVFGSVIKIFYGGPRFGFERVNLGVAETNTYSVILSNGKGDPMHNYLTKNWQKIFFDPTNFEYRDNYVSINDMSGKEYIINCPFLHTRAVRNDGNIFQRVFGPEARNNPGMLSVIYWSRPTEEEYIKQTP